MPEASSPFATVSAPATPHWTGVAPPPRWRLDPSLVFPAPRRRPTGSETPALDRQLRELIDEHASAVYQLAFGMLHDRGLAEDVVQETMIKAWRSLGTFRGDSSMRTWVLRIAHNTSIDAMRRRRDRSFAPEDLPETAETEGGTEDPAARAAGRSDLATLRSALGELDELSRSIVVLREIEGLSYAQIAATLDISTALVKTRLLRARRSLQRAVRPPEQT
jgi:RNA polymerase sigma-70 factor (ECF subfamily)